VIAAAWAIALLSNVVVHLLLTSPVGMAVTNTMIIISILVME
jgi:hypothetical protein